MKRIIALCAALLWLGGANAYAQDADHAWGTPGGAIVNGAIGMCLNSSGLAIPIGANCVPAGTVTPSNTSAAPLYVVPGTGFNPWPVADSALLAAVQSAVPLGGNRIGYTSDDPCTQAAKTNVPISTASGTTALVTGVSAKKIYICSLAIITPSAISVSLSEGSSNSCGTSNQAGVIGVATNGTAANGMALPANGGLTLGSGHGTVAATATAADYLCLFQSGTAQIAGNLTYVQQ